MSVIVIICNLLKTDVDAASCYWLDLINWAPCNYPHF
jgi:hypothetical protein